jgi:hypothetical protein
MIDIKKCIRSSSTLFCIVTKKTMIFIFFYTLLLINVHVHYTWLCFSFLFSIKAELQKHLVTTSYTMAINSGLFIGRWLCECYPYLYIKFWYVASVQIKPCLLDLPQLCVLVFTTFLSFIFYHNYANRWCVLDFNINMCNDGGILDFITFNTIMFLCN